MAQIFMPVEGTERGHTDFKKNWHKKPFGKGITNLRELRWYVLTVPNDSIKEMAYVLSVRIKETEFKDSNCVSFKYKKSPFPHARLKTFILPWIVRLFGWVLNMKPIPYSSAVPCKHNFQFPEVNCYPVGYILDNEITYKMHGNKKEDYS